MFFTRRVGRVAFCCRLHHLMGLCKSLDRGGRVGSETRSDESTFERTDTSQAQLPVPQLGKKVALAYIDTSGSRLSDRGNS